MAGIQAFAYPFFDNVLKIHEIKGHSYDYTFEGYNDLRFLYDINKILSDEPYGEIIDRTGKTTYPFKLHIRQPYILPEKDISLKSACENKIKEICKSKYEKYVVCWSGGIDSTLMLVTMLQQVEQDKIIVFLSNRSIAENPEFYKNYIENKLTIKTWTDKIYENEMLITGDPADTIWAILDNSFFSGDSYEHLYSNYQDYFLIRGADEKFLEKTDTFMKLSGKKITTLFEARWWFYLNCKSQSKSVSIIPRFNIEQNFCPFFESHDFDSWSYYNTDKMIIGKDWSTYKFQAKEIIYKFDKNYDYYKNKSKELSDEPITRKFQTLTNKKNNILFVTDNGDAPILSSGNFFSKELYMLEYYEKYKHLFLPT